MRKMLLCLPAVLLLMFGCMQKMPAAGLEEEKGILPGFYEEGSAEAYCGEAYAETDCEQATSHAHEPAIEPQSVEEPFVGFCGNTWTVVHIGDEEYGFMGGHSVELTDLLLNLDYNRNIICRCIHEFTVDTEFGTGYQINLTQGFARCKKGQASLTEEQIRLVSEILSWAEGRLREEGK